MRGLLAFLSFVGIFGFAPWAYAHQPHLLFKEANAVETPFVIQNPQVSQAFYGEFRGGNPQYFRMTFAEASEIYLGIHVPRTADAAEQVTLLVSEKGKNSESLLTLNGADYPWKPFYEEMAGDWFLEGPGTLSKFQAGTYTLRVTSKKNKGKYVLLIGNLESFPLSEIPATLHRILLVKMEFFGRSFFSFFDGAIGKALLVVVFFIFFLLILLAWLYQRLWPSHP